MNLILGGAVYDQRTQIASYVLLLAEVGECRAKFSLSYSLRWENQARSALTCWGKVEVQLSLPLYVDELARPVLSAVELIWFTDKLALMG